MTNSRHRKPFVSVHHAKRDRYVAVLKQHTESHSKVTTVVLATPDGFEVAAVHYQGEPRSAQFAAMAGSLIAVARAAGREVGHEGCDGLIVESPNGKLLIRPVGKGDGLLLCMVLAPGMLLGAALWAADEIGKAISLI
ncbi:Roadblock/LC7 domain protein [Variovorax sp. SRS16]|uniref:roadblock/LC7 domain-containing protein n=1 Tax=Variovorax sp. SRS16 TaxID=282217 RepID=UPI0013188AF1|nr:roadblock/LC7 domain-containing protein [Variovorax sp. SRS16]VTU19133.1 Roadblock/LC7 domain protein [Variovorax sp. SRS16]